MKRRRFFTQMGLGLIATIAPGYLAAAITERSVQLFSVTFYVAVDGNDDNPGTLTAPFATLERAHNAIRQLKKQQGKLKQPVLVIIRGGTYYLSQPLVFLPQDSGTAACPIIFKAYPGEQPVISGGKLITNWRQEGHLWTADLDQVKREWYFRLLRVGNDWAVRARYPNYKPGNPNQSWLFAQQRSLDRPKGSLNNYLGYIGYQGDRVWWEMAVAQAGTYQIWLRYARKHTYAGSMSGKTAISVNGEQVVLDNLPNTDGWENFNWSLVGTIELPAGMNILQWENLTGGSINLDTFCFTNDDGWQPTSGDDAGNLHIPAVSSGKQQIIVYAEIYSKIKAIKGKVVSSQRYRIPLAEEQFPNWSDWTGAEVHSFLRYGYGNGIFPIAEVDRESQSLFGDFTQSNYSVVSGNRFYIENVREALDSPGEWYLNRQTGKLSYWAQAGELTDVEIVAPTLDKLIVLQGDRLANAYVEYLKFQDLTFKDTDYSLAKSYFEPHDAAIWLKFARNCTINNCQFSTLGGHGIRLEGNSHHNRLVRNQIKGLGQGGIILSGVNINSQPHHNIIAANEIDSCGRIYKHVAGIYLSTGSYNQIIHNQISNLPRYGISLKSLSPKNRCHHNLIEFNHLENICLETADTGAIEILGRDRLLSYNMIRFNLIRNVVGMKTTAQGEIMTPYYSWGIYLDDFSSGTTIYGNIVVGTVLGSVMIHGGQKNIIENNIFINGSKNQIQLTAKDDFMRANVIRRNIIIYDRPEASSIKASGKPWKRQTLAESDFNIFWGSNLQNFQSVSQGIFPEGSFAQWQAAGFERHSLVAEPQIADWENNDYRLSADSPAFKVNFRPIPIHSVGINGYSRAKLLD